MKRNTVSLTSFKTIFSRFSSFSVNSIYCILPLHASALGVLSVPDFYFKALAGNFWIWFQWSYHKLLT